MEMALGFIGSVCAVILGFGIHDVTPEQANILVIIGAVVFISSWVPYVRKITRVGR